MWFGKQHVKALGKQKQERDKGSRAATGARGDKKLYFDALASSG